MGPLAKLMVGVRILLRRPSLFFKGGVKVLRSFGYSKSEVLRLVNHPFQGQARPNRCGT